MSNCVACEKRVHVGGVYMMSCISCCADLLLSGRSKQNSSAEEKAKGAARMNGFKALIQELEMAPDISLVMDAVKEKVRVKSS